MAVEHVKSTPVTDLDATPRVVPTAGKGANGDLSEVSATVTYPASSSIDSTFRYVRVPTNCVVKSVKFASAAQAAGAVDIGLYYPTTGKTGLPDLAANAIDQDFFASAVSVAAASGMTDVTFEGGTGYILSEINTPLWQAAGLTTDPGGYFDVVATVTTAVTTGAAATALRVEYVVP